MLTAIMTWLEMQSKYPEQRDEMSIDREREFVSDCFDLYERTEKLADTFWTPFTSYQDKIGSKFKVLRRVDELDCDLCALPQWHIVLEDGTELDAYPEEIYQREQIANGRKSNGSWITAWIDGSLYYRCSECGTYIDSIFFANDYSVRYCPQCGVHMNNIDV